MKDGRISDTDLYYIAGSRAVEDRKFYEFFSTLPENIAKGLSYGMYFTGMGLYYGGVAAVKTGTFLYNLYKHRNDGQDPVVQPANDAQALPQNVEQVLPVEQQNNPVWLTRYFNDADIEDYDSDSDSDYQPENRSTRVLRSANKM